MGCKAPLWLEYKKPGKGPVPFLVVDASLPTKEGRYQGIQDIPFNIVVMDDGWELFAVTVYDKSREDSAALFLVKGEWFVYDGKADTIRKGLPTTFLRLSYCWYGLIHPR